MLAACADFVAGSAMRSKFAFTAAASNFSPSVNVTSSRRWKV